MKRNYELVAILSSEIKSSEQEETVSRIKKIISSVKGELTSTDDWGKKEFSYPINKKSSGVYFLFKYQAGSETVASIKQKLQLEEKIVRYLLTVIEVKARGGKDELKVA